MTSSFPPAINPAMVPSMAPPSGMEPNFVNPVTLADAVIGVSATTSVLAVVLLSIRLYSTVRITQSASYDDGASILAMIFSLAYMGLYISTKDSARHGWDLPISAYTASFFKILLSDTIIAALGFLFSKISILLLLFRLFSPTQKFRYLVYIGIIWATLISLTTLLVAGILCAPRSGESFSSLTVAERCIHVEVWAVVQGALYMSLDFYILYLPIPMVWKLQMRQKQKIGVMAIFMTGFIACIASTLSLVYKVKLMRGSDKSWNSAKVDILSIVELNVAIMVACMPACASFSRHFFAKFGIVSSIKSRFSPTKRRKQKSSEPKHTIAASNLPLGSNEHPASGGKYWRLKSLFSNERDGMPPQITFNKQQSRVLQSGDFNVFDNDKGLPSSTEYKEETSSEKEQIPVGALYNIG